MTWGDDDADVIHLAAHHLPAHALRAHGEGRQGALVASPEPGKPPLGMQCA